MSGSASKHASGGKGNKAQKEPTFSENIVCKSVVDFAGVAVLVVRITPDKKYWVVGLSNGVIKLSPVVDDGVQTVQTLQAEGETEPCVDLECIPCAEDAPPEARHQLISVYVSGYVRIWHYAAATPTQRLLTTIREEMMSKTDMEGRPVREKKKYNQILAVSCSLDGKRCVTGGDDSHIRVYSLAERVRVGLCASSFGNERMDGHVRRICALKYHPRGKEDQDYAHVFISGGWDDTIQIWDDRYSHSIWIYAGPHIAGSDALDIEPESNQILSSSWRHDKSLLQVWQFNERVLGDFYSKAVTNPDGSLSFPYGMTIGGAFNANKPVVEVAQQSFQVRSKGYVARWVTPSYIAFGGSDRNVLRILSRGKDGAIASVTGLPNGVFSLDFMPAHDENLEEGINLAFAAGTKIYIAHVTPP
ncbi:unnamed protein product [Calicophoron daubneyi]|uniref:Uncharacterized protein n=1 Tax=Calicophoron daubneyi TaxID=300641 RepID=A0AAV2T0R0_CALDB